MNAYEHQQNDEIDLAELAETLSDNKWMIFKIVILFVVMGFGYRLAKPPVFSATTEIKAITSIEQDRYAQSNAVGFFKVDKTLLRSLYLEQVQDLVLFEKAIKKYQLIDSQGFEDEAEYASQVSSLASKIVIKPPFNTDGSGKGEVRQFWTIHFEHPDKVAWKNVLLQVHNWATEEVRQVLMARFKLKYETSVFIKNFMLEDLDLKIENALSDYESKTEDRLAYLGEQAAIARKLGVAKNTIEAQSFDNQSTIMTNVSGTTPFYLRGFEAIEKEIELIQSRDDKSAFISGLLSLEQSRREKLQDRTLYRAKALFEATPAFTGDAFNAVRFNPDYTQFTSRGSSLLVLAVSAVLGVMFGIFYVLISNAIRKRKENL